MLVSCVDHLTITAPSLAEGVDYARRALGVAPLAGGAHPRMGTHNCLLKLGDELFLEVIAIDPAAAAPPRPRWFQLDDTARQPGLSTWVVRSNDIHAAAAACDGATGQIEPMTRGALEWLITIPSDGSLPLQGLAPALIKWQGAHHPARALPDAACALLRLDLFHPDPGRLADLLCRIGLRGPVAIFALAAGMPAYLRAHIQTPAGMRQLGGPVAR
ncbi:hypothetical protein AAKU55_000935 [Oxalobacteraceae bacterium GrIS 1.11]